MLCLVLQIKKKAWIFLNGTSFFKYKYKHGWKCNRPESLHYRWETIENLFFGQWEFQKLWKPWNVPLHLTNVFSPNNSKKIEWFEQHFWSLWQQKCTNFESTKFAGEVGLMQIPEYCFLIFKFKEHSSHQLFNCFKYIKNVQQLTLKSLPVLHHIQKTWHKKSTFGACKLWPLGRFKKHELSFMFF